MTRPFLGMVAIMVFAVGGCRSTRESHYNGPPPSPRVQPTILQYIDADGFDVLFEVSLINQDPVIIVRTENEKPDWEGRLNAWIAAWSIGGKVDHLVVRGQIPLPAQLRSEERRV